MYLRQRCGNVLSRNCVRVEVTSCDVMCQGGCVVL